MSVRLVDPAKEVRVVKTAIHSDRLRGEVLSRCQESTFGWEPARELFDAMLRACQTGRPVSLRLVADSPSLSDKAREYLKSKSTEYEPYTNKAEVQAACSDLDSLRQQRTLFRTASNIVEAIKVGADHNDVFTEAESGLIEARQANSLDDMMVIGEGDTPDNRRSGSLAELSHVLNGKNSIGLQTGFTTFDRHSGGLQPTNMLVMSARRGDGKSSLLNQLCLNAHVLGGKSVCLVNLELSRQEVIERIASNITGIPHAKFAQKTLTRRERLRSIMAWQDLTQLGIETGTRFVVYTPSKPPNAVTLSSMMASMGFDFIALDYLTLLEPIDSRSEKHTQLGESAWALKTMAKSTGAVVAVLTHMTEDWEVKFSREVENHADRIWGWRLSRQDKEEGVARIRQLKVRNGREFDFTLSVDLGVHQWTCPGLPPVGDGFEPSKMVRGEIEAMQQINRKGRTKQDRETEAAEAPAPKSFAGSAKGKRMEAMIGMNLEDP